MAKQSKNFVLATISLDRLRPTPLYLQLYRELREAIETGRFHPRGPAAFIQITGPGFGSFTQDSCRCL